MNALTGISKVHKAVKEQNPNWQCSEDRVKKILAEMVVIGPDGKPLKKGVVCVLVGKGWGGGRERERDMWVAQTRAD